VNVFVNGEAHDVANSASVSDLLRKLAAPSAGIAVEINRMIVRRSDHATQTLSEGDRVEIVGLVGGG
jgi:sulfur carrier protein